MGGLARVVEQQRRQHQAVPHRPDRFAANGPHVRIKGLAAGDRQEHGAEHDESGARIVEEECNRMRRVEGSDDAGLAHDAPKPEPAMVTNQTSTTGPNAHPMRAVPRFCTANRTTRIATAIGMTCGLKKSVATLRPSSALRTEIAGVTMPSP